MKKYKRDILPAPEALVGDGNFNHGTFTKPIMNLNPLDARCYPIPLPRVLKNLRLKEWQAYEMGKSDYFVFTVLYKAKSIALAQFIVYDRINKEKFLYEKIVPSWSVSLPDLTASSAGNYKDKNFSIEFNNEIMKKELNLNVSIKNMKGLPDVKAELHGIYDNKKWEPLVVSLPFNDRRAMYSHKCLMPMEGEIISSKFHAGFKKKDSFMIIDDHKGFYPYSSFYDWVTGVKSDGKGGLTGFNLTFNQVKDPEKYNENGIWINGKLSPLPPVSFSRPDGPDGEWLIKDSYGMVDIKFVPEVQGKVDVNLLVLKTYYRGPLGKFYGKIKDSTGKTHSVDNFFGMGEEKKLRM